MAVVESAKVMTSAALWATGDAKAVKTVATPSPWRSVATDPPSSYVGVLASTDSLPVVAFRDDANAWWDCPDGRPLVAPAWWMPIPPLPVSP